MDFITLDLLIRVMHESQDLCVFDVTENNVGSIEDMCTGMATIGSILYTGKVRELEYKVSKDFDQFRVTDFFSTTRDSITVKVVRIPNLRMDYSPRNGFEVRCK